MASRKPGFKSTMTLFFESIDKLKTREFVIVEKICQACQHSKAGFWELKQTQLIFRAACILDFCVEFPNVNSLI